MKTLLINPERRSVEAIDVRSRADLTSLIGYDTIDSDTVGTAGDRLYFDEECFLRGTTGRFQIDSIIPVSGRAVVVGTAECCATLRDVASDIEDMRARIKYV